MPRTESYYANNDAERAISDPYLLERHSGNKTGVVCAALKEYFDNHRPNDVKTEKKPKRVVLEV